MNIALFSLFGVFVGAILQYFFTRHLESLRHLRDLKTLAYTNYMLCVSEHANFGKSGHPHNDSELMTKTADAKSRVCLYASPKIIEAFANFENLGATMNTQEQRTAFVKMVSLMRLDSGIKGAANLSSIETVLLGGGKSDS